MRWTLGWWCRVCGCMRPPIRYPQIGAMCPECRSGRIAPVGPPDAPFTMFATDAKPIPAGGSFPLPRFVYTIG